jgi:hypothetical protein
MLRRHVNTKPPLVRRDTLAAGLKNRPVEAEDIRIRFTRALDGTLWPTRRSLSRMFADHETTDAQH